jgi:hypothetical protein
MRRYFFGLFIVIILLILLIVLIAHGGSKAKLVPASSRTLESYAQTNAVVDITIDGPITAPQNHEKVEISVSNTSATIQVFQGYDGNVVASKSYPNTEVSFNSFLHALDYAGFTKGNDAISSAAETGACALGNRYSLQLQQNGKYLENYWTTNCGNVNHSFEGDFGDTMELFENQIPDYNDIVNNVNI